MIFTAAGAPALPAGYKEIPLGEPSSPVKNGQPEYFALNTGSSVSEKSKWDGKGGTGWGKFGKSNSKYKLYWHVPKKKLNCKVR